MWVNCRCCCFFLRCKIRRASLKAVVVFCSRKPSFCASFDGKCPKTVVLVEGPHFEQLSMENLRNRFFSKKKSRNFGGAPGELRGSSGELRGAPGSSGELRGAPGNSGESSEKVWGIHIFRGERLQDLFDSKIDLTPKLLKILQSCLKIRFDPTFAQFFARLVPRTGFTLNLLDNCSRFVQKLILPRICSNMVHVWFTDKSCCTFAPIFFQSKLPQKQLTVLALQLSHVWLKKSNLTLNLLEI